MTKNRIKQKELKRRRLINLKKARAKRLRMLRRKRR